MTLSSFSIQFHHSSSSHLSLSLFSPFPSSSRRPRWPRMDAASAYHRHRRKDKVKVVVIMGATGTGKSRLSVELATRCACCSEIINSDKMQVYKGLDITTNKIPLADRSGVPHHLLGDVDPGNGEFSPSDFRLAAGSIISDISRARKLPIVVGGSTSFVHALLVDRFDPGMNVFDDGSSTSSSSSSSSSISSELRYKCCFLWVDVSFPVLSDYLSKRVDDMLELGMVDELSQFFDPEASDLEHDSSSRVGLRKAIGVPEFDRYFKRYPPTTTRGVDFRRGDDRVRKGAYEDAVSAIKDNTCQLAKRQIGKILRLKGAGWDLRRLDATEAFRAAMTTSGCSGGGERWPDIWERQVAEPSVNIVKRFLKE